MAIDPALFKIRFPEFGTENVDRIQLFIDDSVLMLNETWFGSKYDLGLYYLTAHCLTLSNESKAGSDSPVAPIASQAVDGVSIGFATIASDDEWKNYFNSTVYGQRYLALIKTLGVPAYVI